MASLSELLTSSLLAIVRPFKTFKSVSDEAVDYTKIIPFLFFAGIVWIHLHGYILFTEPVWSSYSRWVFYSLLFGFFAVFIWLIGGLSVWLLHRVVGGQHTLAFVERGVFYLTMFWALMPFMDLPHLWAPLLLADLPFVGVHPLHISDFVAAVIIPLELLAFLGTLFDRKYYFIVGLAALLALPLAKFVIQDLGFLLEEFLFSVGLIKGKYEDYVFGFIAGSIFWITYIGIRAYIFRWRARLAALGIIGGGLTLSLVIIVMFLIVAPAYPGYASDSGFLDSRRDWQSKSKDFPFLDTIHIDGDLLLKPIRELTCVVNFIEIKGAPRARCDIAPGPEKGEGEYFLGEVWEGFRGSSKQATVFRDPQILKKLTEKNNDIRVHLETSPNEFVSFSGVWIEIVR